MKSIATLTAVAALASVTSAQVTYNSSTGKFSCPISNGAYCAGPSLDSNIIIRCINGIGQPGNCNDNLAGDFPYGVNSSPCWETSDKSGDAACSKNCIVQGDSGNFNGTFTLPNCTPIPNPSATPPLTGSTTTTSTGTSTIVVGSTTEVITFTTTFCPTNTSTPIVQPSTPIVQPTTPVITPPTVPSVITTAILPSGIFTIVSSGTAVDTGRSGGGSGGGAGSAGSSGVHNGTAGGSGAGGSATATPVGPSKTATGAGAPEYTGSANVISVGGLAAIGAIFAWFL